MSAVIQSTLRDYERPAPDFGAIKAKQQATWGSGDYAIIGTTLQIVGESLCEAADIRAGEKVLDVAAGNGNATLAAARRFADVVSTDFVGTLLASGQARAEAEGLTVDFRIEDAEALDFSDDAFDACLSTYGVMFTPNHEQSASEMVRVTRPGGRIGLANWTPESFVGQVFKAVGRLVPPPAGLKPPSLWGTADHLESLFGDAAADIAITRKQFVFRYRSPEHWLDLFRTYYGPVHKAFEALDPAGQETLERDLTALLNDLNRCRNGTLVVPSDYLEVVVTKA